MKSDCFSAYHPIVNFIYFCFVIITSMFFLHPVILACSLTGAFIYAFLLYEKKILKLVILMIVPVMLIAALVNPLFNHRGETILMYAFDNPITLESMVYGVMAGAMIGAVILWFFCYNAVMTSDKFTYLFGRVIPGLALIFSMVLRFIPRFRLQMTKIAEAQQGMGRAVGQGTKMQRLRQSLKMLSIMLTWSLENAVDTADSMRSRGYGLPGRTNFSLFRFDMRDGVLLVVISALIAVVLISTFAGFNTMQFFPFIRWTDVSGLSTINYICYGCLCILPVILELHNLVTWRKLQQEEV